MTKSNRIVEDLARFHKHLGENNLHPINKFLYLAFDERQEGVDENGHDWDLATARFLDRVYMGGLGDYVSKLAGFKAWTSPAGPKDAIAWFLQSVGREKFQEAFRLDRYEAVSPKELRDLSEKITSSSLEMKIALGVGRGMGPIAFCSKYAFFVTRAAPVLDSNAEKGLARLTDFERGEDEERYTSYVNAIIDLLRTVYTKKERYTTREIKNLDGYLYEIGRKAWPGPEKEKS